MNEAQQLLDDGLRMQESVLGDQTFIYRGKHWPCSANALSRGMDLGLGPPTNQLTRTLIVRKTAMAIRTADQNEGWNADSSEPNAGADVMPPHPGKIVIFQQRQYEVESVEEDSAGAAWKVRLVSPDS